MTGFALVLAAAAVLPQGWLDRSPERTFPVPSLEVWRAPIEKGLGCLDIDWRDGATGTVTVAELDGTAALRVEKKNAAGYLLIRPKKGFSAKKGMRLRSFAACASRDGDGESQLAFLAMYAGGKEDLSHFAKFDKKGRGGPRQTRMVSTPPGTPDRKLCHLELSNDDIVTPAIIVAGAPSTSYWNNWGVEDFTAAENAWKNSAMKRKTRALPDCCKPVDDAEFDRMVAAEPDHVAKVACRDGFARLVVDGKERLPLMFKYSTGATVHGDFTADMRMAAGGVDIQVVFVRMGVTSVPGRGHWSAAGFDCAGAVGEIRRKMMRVPRSKFILSVGLDAYPEFAGEHPGEAWMDANGRPVWGDAGHTLSSPPKETEKKGRWIWVSNHSLVWREAVKKNLSMLIAELKRTGLAKLVVGVHLAGFHDGQFATGMPDFSAPACAAFREWQKREFGEIRFEGAPAYGAARYVDPVKEAHQAAYLRFMKQAPFAMQEDVARHVKRAFGKSIVAIRYCMTPFGGSFNAAYDFVPFVNSDAIDILCAQPDYGRRLPALSLAHRVPLESSHAHGKLFLNEFDLRTYGACAPWEPELSSMGFSRVTDHAQWCTVHRRLAGQMFAKRMGWWYLDMAGGWFDPPEIAADIADVKRRGEELAVLPPDPWRPDVAVAVDEDGALLRNLVGKRWNPDEQLMGGGQIQMLGQSGVPYDYWLLEDFLRRPELAERYRMIVFFGMYDMDGRRLAFIDRMKRNGRTLAFLSGAGRIRGLGHFNLALDEKKAPADHAVVPESGFGVAMYSQLAENVYTQLLGIPEKDWRHRFYSPDRMSLSKNSAVKPRARYLDGAVAVGEQAGTDWRIAYVAEPGAFTPDYFRFLAAAAGAYVPTERSGLEVDMNGDFISLHCIRPGRYTFKFPFPATVVDLKIGMRLGVALKSLDLEMEAGETRWYALQRLHTCN